MPCSKSVKGRRHQSGITGLTWCQAWDGAGGETAPMVVGGLRREGLVSSGLVAADWQ